MPISRLLSLALVALVAAAPSAQPDLSLSSFLEENDRQAEAGDRVTVEYTVTNAGDQDVEDATVAFYFSTDAFFDGGDQFLEAEGVNVEAGESEGDSEQFNLPSVIADGEYFVLTVVDPNNVIPETDETNNVDANPITIGEGGGGGTGPDLVVSASYASGSPEPGQAVTFNYTVSNTGDQNSGPFTTRVVFSTDTVPDGGDPVLTDIDNDGTDAGDTSDNSVTITIPSGTADGTYFVVFEVDADGQVSESNEANNTTAVQIEVSGGGGGGGTGPDLVVSGSLPDGSPQPEPGESVNVDYTLSNVGDTNSGPLTLRFYFSDDPTLDGGDQVLLDVGNDGVDAGDTSDDTATLSIPDGTSDGTYYILLEADADGEVAESDESNNTASVEIEVAGGPGGTPVGEVGVFIWEQQEPDTFYPVFLERTYTNPVVVAPSFSSGEEGVPAVPRVQAVTADRFEIQLAEWPYLDGTHQDLFLPYLVVEAGVHTLDDGRRIEAGFTTANPNGVGQINFSSAFPGRPVVFAQALGGPTVTARLRVRDDFAQVQLVQQEAGGAALGVTQVAWVAIEAGPGDGVRPAVVKRVRVDDTVTITRYGTTVSTGAVILAATQSIASADPAVVRVLLSGRIGGRLFLQEEQSADAETSRPDELVGYAVFERGMLTASPVARPALARASAEAAPLGVRPNPLSSLAVIAFEVAETGHVEVTVFDVTGRRVATLSEGAREPGVHEVAVDASGWPAGVYLVRLASESGVETVPMTVVR